MTDGTGFAGGIIGFMRNNRVQLAYDGKFDEAATQVLDEQGRPRTISHGPITWCTAGPVADTLEFPSDVWFNMLVGTLGASGPNTTTARTLTLTRSKGSVERASYSGNFMGFVFGYKNGTEWNFYFNGIGAGTQILKRIF